MAGLPDIGSKPAILEPKLQVAELGSTLPAPIDGDLGMDWNEGLVTPAWLWIPYTANGVLMTPANPKVGYPSDEVGDIAQLSAGTENVTWSFQARTPGAYLLKWLGGFKKTVHEARGAKLTLTLSVTATTAGSLVITLEDVATNVTITSGDTPTVAAGKVVAAFASDPNYDAVAGSTGGTVVLTQATPHKIPDSVAVEKSFSGGATGITGSFATTAPDHMPYRKKLTRYNLDPRVNNDFMCGIEGSFADHSLEAVGGLVRAFAYRAQQTENPQIPARKSGADAPVQPVATLRCQPEVVAEDQWEESGLPEIDEYGRYDLVFIEGTGP